MPAPDNEVVSASTAGKGPGIVLRAANRSGTVRVSVARGTARALLEVLDASGERAELGLTVEELHTLSQVLRRVATALTAESLLDEVTQR